MIATPLHDGTVTHQYLQGALQTLSAFRGRLRFETQIGSILPRNRDLLTQRFIDSNCTHLLFIDGDVGWRPDDVTALIDSHEWVVSGCYPRKQQDKRVPARLLSQTGTVRAAKYAPAGFLLIARPAIAAMVDAYGEALRYGTQQGEVTGLWQPIVEPGRMTPGEDIAFCARWRAIGGKVMVHTGVRLSHTGSHTWSLPEGDGVAFDGSRLDDQPQDPRAVLLADALAGMSDAS